MLFQSREFIFIFLPIALAVFLYLKKQQQLKLVPLWTLLCSLFFYAYWHPIFLSLFIISILGNFYLGIIINRYQSKLILTLGICANLALISYFKYTPFIVSILKSSLPNLYAPEIILPIGISFFTFQQIAYLIDVYQDQRCESKLITYALFVSFFPQLIAGPIVHHKEMMPQFEQTLRRNNLFEDLSVGISIFTIGLFKKAFIADSIARYADDFFNYLSLHPEYKPDMFEAWGGALIFGMQIYFDFSGYSDMAIGLGRLFGIVLPVNFWSPYRASSIISFWRRWHLTLSRVLRDYLYLPLGGNRKGKANRYLNLMVVMLIGGLWHGAGWKFMLWGGLHGIFLIINHSFRWAKGIFKIKENFFLKTIATIITFIAANIAWVPFRAKNLEVSMQVYSGMISARYSNLLEVINHKYFFSTYQLTWIVLLSFWVFFLPNTQQWMSNYKPIIDIYQLFKTGEEDKKAWWKWQPNILWACYTAILFFIGICSIRDSEAFIYFQF